MRFEATMLLKIKESRFGSKPKIRFEAIRREEKAKMRFDAIIRLKIQEFHLERSPMRSHC